MAREVKAMQFDGEGQSDDGLDTPQRVATRTGGDKEKHAVDIQEADLKTLFVDEEGSPLGFCLELDNVLDEDDQNILREKIRKCGGMFQGGYQAADYILVDLSTSIGADFFSMHSTPTRRIVSKDFIQESIDRGKLVPYSELTLFIKEDRPVVFYLHESLENGSEKLRQDILLRGGDPRDKADQAQVVIHDADWTGGKQLKAKFPDIVRLESLEWINSCIKRNRFTLGKDVVPIVSSHNKTVPNNGSAAPKQTAPRRRPDTEEVASRPGRKPGAPRNEFTKKDDEFLVAWIATFFGKTMAGRSGNRAYKDMVQIEHYLKYSYTHTWQSWRERYKNKKRIFDPLIEAYIAKHGTAHHVEGDPKDGTLGEIVIPHSQGSYTKARSRKRKAKGDGEDGEESDESHHSEESYRPPHKKGKRKAQTEKDVEESQDAPQDPSSSKAPVQKRARITESEPESIQDSPIIKTSSSQKVAKASSSQNPPPSLASQKPAPPSQKPSSSQKPASSRESTPEDEPMPETERTPTPTAQKPTSLQKTAVPPPRKAARRPRPSDSSPTRSSDYAPPSSDRISSSPAHLSTKGTDQPQLKPRSSAATTSTLLESQNSRYSTSSQDDAPPFPMDPALSSTMAAEVAKEQDAINKNFETLDMAGSGEEEDEDEEEDIDVGGVSQYQRQVTQDELDEKIEEELDNMSKDSNVSLTMVKSIYYQMKNEVEEEDVMDLTRIDVEKLAKKLRR